MTPIETGRVFVCYVEVGGDLTVRFRQYFSYGGAEPQLADFQYAVA